MVGTRGGVWLGVTVLIGTLALSGCSMLNGGTGDASSAATASASQAVETPATSIPSPTATVPTLNISCSSVLSLQNVYDFNPNYTEDPSVSTPNEIVSVVAAGGKACSWVNLSSGETFSVAVARLDPNLLAVAANTSAAMLTAVPTYGTGSVEGFFGVQSGVGVADAFTGTTWVRIVSTSFLEPGDAGRLMETVLRNVG